MVADRLLSSFHSWAGTRPGLDPGIADMLVQLKATHLRDPQPGRWRRGDLETVLLELAPEHVGTDDGWYGRALPTARAFVEHARREGLLHKGSAALPLLLQELDAVEQQVIDGVRGGSQAPVPARGDEDDDWDAYDVDPWDDGLEDDWDDEEPDPEAIDPVEVEALRPVRLATRDELAAAARESRLLHELERLMRWVGVGRAVTDEGALTREELLAAPLAIGVHTDSSRFGAEFDVEGRWRVGLLWAIARAAGFVDADGKALPGPPEATLGQMLHEPGPAADEHVLNVWAQAMSVVIGHDETGRESELVGEFVDRTATDLLFAAYDDEPQSIGETLDAFLAQPLPNVPRRVREKVFGDVDLALEKIVRNLHDLQAITSASKGYDDVELTPLGRFGVREYAVARGVDAPLLDDLARLDVPDFLQVVLTASVTGAVETREEIVREWFAGRGRGAATHLLVDFAPTGTPIQRGVVIRVLRLAWGDCFDHLAQDLSRDALLGPLARSLLAQGAVAERFIDGGRPVDKEDAASEAFRDLLTGHGWLHADMAQADRDVLVMESIAVAVEREGRPIRHKDLPARLWALVDEHALTRLAAMSHPYAPQVLDAIGSARPAGRIRKAAKKAAHKARIGT